MFIIKAVDLIGRKMSAFQEVAHKEDCYAVLLFRVQEVAHKFRLLSRKINKTDLLVYSNIPRNCDSLSIKTSMTKESGFIK